MGEFTHIPVLVEEVLAHLQPRPGGLFVDGTVGGAGHAVRILEASAPDGRLIGIDRDPTALAAARDRLGDFGDRVTLVHDTFGNVAQVLRGLAVAQVNGVLLDLGLSSPQLDRPVRGFSFSADGPLDMRMDPQEGETALDLIRRLDARELAAILRDYGEERYHQRIAARMKEAARAGRLMTTGELAALVASCIPAAEQRRSKIHPATRTFQGIRIAVNRELDELERFLAVFPDLLAPRGRCAIISFHSLEDRLVKQRFRDLAWTSGLPPRLAAEAGERSEPICVPVTRRPVFAGDEEVARNPRARSARLRVCEKAVAP